MCPPKVSERLRFRRINYIYIHAKNNQNQIYPTTKKSNQPNAIEIPYLLATGKLKYTSPLLLLTRGNRSDVLSGGLCPVGLELESG
jgi:hypothetical protein